MNRLLDHIITERNGHYCHALELESAYSFEHVIEYMVNDYKDSFTLAEIIGFFESMELIFVADECSYSEWNDSAEQELYAFDFIQCIKDFYY